MNKNNFENFIPMKDRETHWGDEKYKPKISNFATVLPPDLPPEILKILLLRFQLEEANYKLENIEEEFEYILWKENSLNYSNWSGQKKKAAISRSKELITKEINEIQNEINKIFPIILPNYN